MIVATAGHIDHGKTTLVKALTGVNTSRLPEEKARGITIDIGFAYWQTPGDAITVGFVDVPGHERFVHNMLAGVCGADFVMLVVAADDGVMPQTIEHLHILDLFGITRGVAVITKVDRVADERVAEVDASVRALLAPTKLAGIEVVRVCAATDSMGSMGTTGTGIDELKAILVAHARRSAAPPAKRRFRFAIDRVFTTAGSGTVVTGTVFDGEVAVGARMILSPAGIEVRVRGIQKHGQSASSARAGERCALNLSGVKVSQAERGQWVLDAALDAPTSRIDVRLQILASEQQALRHWTPCHLHIEAEDTMARVALRRGTSIAPGESGYAQLIAARPLAALHGDRFVIRDQSATRTIGGGTVLDPFPPARRVRHETRMAQLAALDTDDAGEALAGLAGWLPSGVDLAWFGRSFNVADDDLAELLAHHDMVALGKDSRAALHRADVEKLCVGTIEALRRFHAEMPRAFGIEIAELRARCAPELSHAHFQFLLRRLVDEQKISVSGSVAKHRKHVTTDNPEDQRLWSCVAPALEAAGLNGMTVAELAATVGVREAPLTDFLFRKARTGDLVRVGASRFYLRRTMAQFAAIAAEAARTSPTGTFKAATFRDQSGIGRGRVIEVLESLDRLHVTQRVGDVRMLCRRTDAPFAEPQ